MLIGSIQDGTHSAGIVYIFDGVTGNQLLSLESPSSVFRDWFGRSVASTINGDILVGASGDDTAATDTGSAYLFEGITTTSGNSPPVLDTIGNKIVNELEPLQFIVTATDTDGDTLSYSLSNSPPIGATIDPQTGEFSWTPTESQDGDNTFDIMVSDDLLSDYETITVTVNEIISGFLAITIDNNGYVGIGTQEPNSRLQISDGYLQLDVISGAPTILDCDDVSEYGRMKVDDTANTSKLYVCTPTGWLVLIGTVINPDSDGDGIEDIVDPLPDDNTNDTFDDGDNTSGSIIRGDQTIAVVDATDSVDGVLVTADRLGGSTPAIITDCDGTDYIFTSGDIAIVTCGSSIKILQGTVNVIYTIDIIGTTTGTATFATDKGIITSVIPIDESTLSAVGKPSSISFPYGLFSWSVIGLNNSDTVSLLITLSNNITSNSQYWKILDGTWINATSILSSNDGDNTITLTITDGGFGDADGMINGMISDPGGIAIQSIAPVITLNGPNPQTIPLGESYQEYLATVSDPDDSNYSGIIFVDDSSLDVSTSGSYPITYTATADDFGNVPIPVIRQIIVYDGAANLISNGSFEDPTVPKRWNTYNSDTPNIEWSMSWNQNNPHVTNSDYLCPAPALLEIQKGMLGGAKTGAQHAELDSHCKAKKKTPSVISQTIQTESGESYDVSFASKKRPGTSNDSNALQVSADGIILGTINEMSDSWQVTTYSLTAISDITEISFSDIGRPDGLGTFLDDILVTKTGDDSNPNLISNGSFEEVTVNDHRGQWQTFDSSQINSWQVSWNPNNPYISGNNYLCPSDGRVEVRKGILGGAYSGSNYAELDSHCYSRFQTPVVISQDVSTIPDVEYELSWYEKARPRTIQNTNGLDISVNEIVVITISQMSDTWTKNTYHFTANSESTTISFADIGIPNTYGTFLDDVFLSVKSNNNNEN